MRGDFENLDRVLQSLKARSVFGCIDGLGETLVEVAGLSRVLRIGDRIELINTSGGVVGAEAVALNNGQATVLPEARLDGFALGDRARYLGQSTIQPDISWAGHVLDAFGKRVDGGALPNGHRTYALRSSPPEALARKPLGPRLESGLALFNTFLPIARGQRIGVFAGHGVGKTTLLGKLVRSVSADVIVLALIGERGREVRDFVQRILGSDAMKRCVVVIATSDQAPTIKRRAAFTAMAIAEQFRDTGSQVLFLLDSVTRFAEAHRDISAAAGELPTVQGFPASMSTLVSELLERAGPGFEHAGGDITAIFSALEAEPGLEDPVADLLRGAVDGQVVLDRDIAARGRFPAVDVLKSTSRSLPEAASQEENAVLMKARRLLADFARSRKMIEAGLYKEGADPELEKATATFQNLEEFLARVEPQSITDSFRRLKQIVE